MLTGSGLVFSWTALLERVAIVPASTVFSEATVVGNFDPARGSSDVDEALPVVGSVVASVAVASEVKALIPLLSVDESAKPLVLLLLVLKDNEAAETGAVLTVFVTKSAEVKFAIVMFDTTAKNSPETV